MDLDALTERLGRRDAIVVGRVGMDFCPDPAGVTVPEGESWVSGMGGSSANIAAGLVKLGWTAGLVTCVSDDGVGRYCRGQLARYGIGDAHVRTVPGQARTSLAVYDSVNSSQNHVIYRNNAVDFLMGTEDVEAVDWGAHGVLVTAGTVFAAEPSRAASFRAFEMARAAGVPIVFDIDYRPYSWPSAEEAADVLSRAGEMADAVVGNDEEFGFMAGGAEKGLAHARGLASAAPLVVYKMGAAGAVTFAGGREIRTGIYEVEALKPTGAGDSFMAGLLAGLGEGRGVEEAVLRGSACASIVVSRPMCAPAMPYPDELDAFIARHPGSTLDAGHPGRTEP